MRGGKGKEVGGKGGKGRGGKWVEWGRKGVEGRSGGEEVGRRGRT